MKYLVYSLVSLGLISCGIEPKAQLSNTSNNEIIELSADECLVGQNLNDSDVDISQCPRIPTYPESTILNDGQWVSLGAWELGMTAEGEAYKYGSLEFEEQGTVKLNYGYQLSTEVNQLNLECWAKGYYRLRHILQDPPEEYIALRDAGFQKSFFQFQTDLRNGYVGYRQISSYRDHLIKWVTVVERDGRCIQPTLDKFRQYAARELNRRGIEF